MADEILSKQEILIILLNEFKFGHNAVEAAQSFLKGLVDKWLYRYAMDHSWMLRKSYTSNIGLEKECGQLSEANNGQLNILVEGNLITS